MSAVTPHTTSGPPPLRTTCEAILRVYWSSVTDVGDVPYDVLANLLRLSSAPQLFLLEDNSPHLKPYTNEIWKALCVADFIEVRKLVEDGRLSAAEEESSWRERYIEEEEKRELKMQAIRSKMRGQYSDYSAGRGTVQSIDGLRQEKRRKTSHAAPARPKTLMDKARSNTRAIASIYAPKRPGLASQKSAQPTAPKPTIARTSRPPARPAAANPVVSASSSQSQKKPLIATVVRTLKRPAPTASSHLDPPSNRPPHAQAIVGNEAVQAARPAPRPPSFSPPLPSNSPAPPSVSRSVSRLPGRSTPLSASPPPPASAVASPPSRSSTTRTAPSLFMPKPRRP